MIKRLSCCLFLVLVFSVSLCAREVISLNKDWTFQKGFI